MDDDCEEVGEVVEKEHIDAHDFHPQPQADEELVNPVTKFVDGNLVNRAI